MFRANVHGWERRLRVAVGVAMLAIGWYYDGAVWSVALRVFGFFPLITGVMGWCPAYTLMELARKNR